MTALGMLAGIAVGGIVSAVLAAAVSGPAKRAEAAMLAARQQALGGAAQDVQVTLFPAIAAEAGAPAEPRVA